MGTWRPISLMLADDRGPLPPHARAPRPRRRLRVLERLLLAIGVLCLGYYAYVSVETALYQAYEARELDAILASAPPESALFTDTLTEPPSPGTERPRPTARPRPTTGTTLGRLEIPRLGVSA